MSLFARIAALFKSNINDAITKAENPEKMLDQIISDMRTQLAAAKHQVAAAIADEKRLHDQAEVEARQAQSWEQKAILALEQGREDLARQALVRQTEHMQHAVQLRQTWEAQRAETEQLKGSLRDLNDRIEEARRKKNLLVARHRRAEASRHIHATMSGLSEKSAFEAFARMEDRIADNERQIKANAEIAGELTGDTLDRQFRALAAGGGSAAIDAQLAALKERSGLALPSGSAPAAAPALPAGAPTSAAVDLDAEMAALEADLAARRSAPPR